MEAQQSHLSTLSAADSGFSPGAPVLSLNTQDCIVAGEISQLCFYPTAFLHTLLLRQTVDDCLLCKVDTPLLRALDGQLFGEGVCLKTCQFSPTESLSVCAIGTGSFVGLEN